MMIAKLKDNKNKIAILFIWFPILFAINSNLTDILYFSQSNIENINAIRIFLYLISFVFLVFYFFLNFKKIEIFRSIFFLYLLIFIIQSNFLFSENFLKFIFNYKIFFSADIPSIEEYISNLNIGLEVQSLYMMIGTFAALLYYINFNHNKFQNIIKLQIIISSFVIIIIYLYFTFYLMKDFLFNQDRNIILLYYSDYLIHNDFFGHEMTRSTGISRILGMISIIAILFFFRFRNNLAKIFCALFIIIINAIIILLASRFAIYSCIIITLLIILFIKSPYLKKLIVIILVSIIPYLTQHIIKEYKLFNLISKSTSLEKPSFSNNYFNNKNYRKIKKRFIDDNHIEHQRNLIKHNKEKNSIEIDTTGRTEIWKRIYGLYLDNKINLWIGNGFQADRKLLKDGISKYYGSNVSNALLNIFICSGIVGVFIFFHINIKILIRIFHFIFIKKIYKNINTNFELIISINILLFLYLRCLVENSISYYNLDFLIFLMCLYIIDREKKII